MHWFIYSSWLILAFVAAVFLGREHSKRKREEKQFIEFMESLHK
jgi:hypothetical protein